MYITLPCIEPSAAEAQAQAQAQPVHAGIHIGCGKLQLHPSDSPASHSLAKWKLEAQSETRPNFIDHIDCCCIDRLYLIANKWLRLWMRLRSRHATSAQLDASHTHSARLVGNTFFSGCLLYDDEQPVAARCHGFTRIASYVNLLRTRENY